MTGPIRVVVADDHPLYLDGLVAALGASADLEVVGQAGDAEGAVALVRRHQPDVAVLDVTMPGGGFEAARAIVATSPRTHVVMLTASEDEDALLAAMRAGANGYAIKGTPTRDLVAAIRSVAAGKQYLAPALAWGVIRDLTRPRETGLLHTLSSREYDVLRLVAIGLTNAEVGARLGLTEKTVKHYMTGVLGKLNLSSRVEAAIFAHQHGVLPVSDSPEAPDASG
jgi:two-component system, NarL family, nitrate/nitrite response regulator NarL